MKLPMFVLQCEVDSILTLIRINKELTYSPLNDSDLSLQDDIGLSVY